MSIQGIQVGVVFEPPAPFTDEWLDAVYSSLEKNMAIVSLDMQVREDEGKVLFLFGVDSSLGDEDFVENVTREAIEKALSDAAGPNHTPEKKMKAGQVEAFV